VLDPASLRVQKRFHIPGRPFDVFAADGRVLLSGGGSGWSEIAAVDGESGRVLARWGGVWARSFVRASPDGKRLYHSSTGVSPGTLEVLLPPEKPGEPPLTYKAAPPPRHVLGGDFLVTPDGRFLLCKTGTVLRTAAVREEDLQFHADVGPFAAAAVAVELGRAFVLGADGGLRIYSYPEFKLRAVRRLPILPTGVAWDGQGGRLYVAGIDPKAVALNPRARGFGDVHVYEVKELLGPGPAAARKD
jgi:hypothetical protein